MTTKLPSEVELQGTEVCSECDRPAIGGIQRVDGTMGYWCGLHKEIHELWGQHDWLYGETYTVEQWIRQVESVPEKTHEVVGGCMILKDEVYPDYGTAKEQHLWTLKRLLAAVETAVELTKKEAERKEAALQK
jgi:hypothetical protein